MKFSSREKKKQTPKQTQKGMLESIGDKRGENRRVNALHTGRKREKNSTGEPGFAQKKLRKIFKHLESLVNLHGYLGVYSIS